MRKLILRIASLLPLVLLCAAGARAQCPSQTPNVGMQIPNIGNTTSWGICLNGDLGIMDNLFGGNAMLTPGTPAPAINKHTNWITANVAPQIITSITGAFPGQTIQIFCGPSDSFTQINASMTMFLTSPWSCITSKSITLTWLGSSWKEVTRQNTFSNAMTAPRLDCSLQPGAPDFGVQVNNCLAQLSLTSYGGGIADLTNFTTPQDMNTPVVNGGPSIIYGCNLTVNLNAGANFQLTSESSSLIGCDAQTFIIYKNSNIAFDVVATGFQNQIQGIDFEGQEPMFTGGGIFLNGTSYASVKHNYLESYTDDIIKLSGTSYTDIDQNVFADAINHTLEDISGGYDIFHHNRLLSSDDETGDSIVTTGSAQLTVSDNFALINRGGVSRVLTSCVSCFVSFTGNSQVTNGGGFPSTQEVLHFGGNVIFSNNSVSSGSTGGAAAVHILGAGVGAANIVTTTDGDGVVLDDSGAFTLSSTEVGVGSNGAEWCGVKITGLNQIGAQVHGVTAGLTPSFPTDGVCVLTKAGGVHMLDIVVDGVYANGFGLGYAFRYNNAGNYNTNVSGTFQNITCTHVAACLKRTDTQNNKNLYMNIQPDGAVDAGTGSNRDVLIQDVTSTSFSSLPSRSVWGPGSRFYCDDCNPGSPATGSGTGALIVAVGSIWKGL